MLATVRTCSTAAPETIEVAITKATLPASKRKSGLNFTMKALPKTFASQYGQRQTKRQRIPRTPISRIEPLNRPRSSPSPLNGERAGVRGETVRLIFRFMGGLPPSLACAHGG